MTFIEEPPLQLQESKLGKIYSKEIIPHQTLSECLYLMEKRKEFLFDRLICV